MDVIKSFLILCLWLKTATPYSIDQQLINAATTPEMFDTFRVMPDGMMKIVHELDMVLSIDQYKSLYTDDDDDDVKGDGVQGNKNNRRRRNKRKAFVRAEKWPNGYVCYEISPNFNTSDRAVIKQAMEEWEKYTCLRFMESETETSRIQFTDGDMCTSAIGMQEKPQTLELASACRTKGIIMHEIGHAIGWIHEHQRPDRDEYLTVYLEKIPDPIKENFKRPHKAKVNTFNIKYDYTSIMHYGGSIKSKDGSKFVVMRVKGKGNHKYQKLMGQSEGLSFKDIKLANLMYDCSKSMGCDQKDCEKDGFQFYKKFKGEPKCQCWCDSGNFSDPLILCSKRKSTPALSDVILPPTTPEPEREVEVKCIDIRQDCKQLKEAGKCTTRMMLMMSYCPKTCGFCGKGKGVCMDYEPGCGVMSGRCKDPGLKSTMSVICKASCDLCASPPDPCEIHDEMFGDYPAPNVSKGVSTLKAIRGFLVHVLMFSLGVVGISAGLIGK